MPSAFCSFCFCTLTHHQLFSSWVWAKRLVVVCNNCSGQEHKEGPTQQGVFLQTQMSSSRGAEKFATGLIMRLMSGLFRVSLCPLRSHQSQDSAYDGLYIMNCKLRTLYYESIKGKLVSGNPFSSICWSNWVICLSKALYWFVKSLRLISSPTLSGIVWRKLWLRIVFVPIFHIV